MRNECVYDNNIRFLWSVLYIMARYRTCRRVHCGFLTQHDRVQLNTIMQKTLHNDKIYHKAEPLRGLKISAKLASILRFSSTWRLMNSQTGCIQPSYIPYSLSIITLVFCGIRKSVHYEICSLDQPASFPLRVQRLYFLHLLSIIALFFLVW